MPKLRALSGQDLLRVFAGFGFLPASQRGVETGVFQAMMEVELANDGPVTLLLDSKKAF